MKLDISCIRAILLTVEAHETIYDPVPFDDDDDTYCKEYLSTYSSEQILYHVRYCIKAGLLSDACKTKSWGALHYDCCLEPLGHDFLANTRTEAKWKHIQSLLLKIGDGSLKVITAVAEGVTTALANKYLPDEISNLVP